MEPSARVICDSVSPSGIRVTTVEGVMHRFVLAEANTHRVFSRNSASSRAIPLRKQLDRIYEDPAIPLSFPQERPGMSGGAEISELEKAREIWLQASESAAIWAKSLGDLGVHKSIPNRLLEPFMWHTVVITATAWENFRGLRVNPGAMPEIRYFAGAVMDAIDHSTPQSLWSGQWHLPYIQPDEKNYPIEYLVQISTARVARTSHLTQNGIRDPNEDTSLYERLAAAWPMHASPMEHVCTPEKANYQEVTVTRHLTDRVGQSEKTLILPKYGNLLGWHQHRFDVEILKGYQAFS